MLEQLDPLRDLRAALHTSTTGDDGALVARVDLGREQRTHVPEVILAERKTAEQTVAIAQRFLETNRRVIISRVPADMLAVLERAFPDPIIWERSADAHTLVLRQPDHVRLRTGGQVGILSAGTSDVPIAEEAAALCREMGCDVHTVYDVGVAGLHRLIAPLSHLFTIPVDVLIVAAGMDGALPSVVAGLAPMPVIGLPTSVGYGMGGRGEAALLTMLQSCAPGLAVVNIDNGVGAGAMAALIANTVAAARTNS